MKVAAMAASMGDTLVSDLKTDCGSARGEFAQSNAAQVIRVRQVIEGLGGEIASPAEAREILALEGGNKFSF